LRGEDDGNELRGAARLSERHPVPDQPKPLGKVRCRQKSVPATVDGKRGKKTQQQKNQKTTTAKKPKNKNPTGQPNKKR